MQIKILGKSHRQGVSKAGNAYDFTEVHYLRHNRYVEGLAATTKTISADVCAYDSIVINGFLDVEFDEAGTVVSAVPIEAANKKDTQATAVKT